MRIQTVIICMGVLALGGCETTKTGAVSSSSKRTTPVPSSLPGQMIEMTYSDLTIKGPFRYHADYLHSFADIVIDNWERVRERHTFSNPGFTTGRIIARVRLTHDGDFANIYIIDRTGPSDLEMIVRRCLRSTSGIPPWDESMHNRFGDDDLLVRLEFEYRTLPFHGDGTNTF